MEELKVFDVIQNYIPPNQVNHSQIRGCHDCKLYFIKINVYVDFDGREVRKDKEM